MSDTVVQNIAALAPRPLANVPLSHMRGAEAHAELRSTFTRIDTVAISQAAREAGVQTIRFDETNPSSGFIRQELHEKDTLAASTSSGTQVSVTREPASTAEAQTENEQLKNTKYAYTLNLQQTNGTSLTLDIMDDDVFIQEQEDGQTSVYYRNANKTRVYGSDGQFNEVEGKGIDDNAGLLIVNTTGQNIQAGSGNNLIFNWSDNTNIETGAGNDTIVLADNAHGVSIQTGDGDDTVIGVQITDSNISLGEGNNRLQAVGMENSSISAGNGDNKITVKRPANVPLYTDADRFSHSSISLGNGNNSLNLTFIRDDSSVTAGDGNNTLNAENISGDASVRMGDGANSVNIDSMGEHEIPALLVATQEHIDLLRAIGLPTGAGQLELGNGNNSLNIRQVGKDAEVSIGDGNNLLSIGNVINNGILTVGDGHNNLLMYEVQDNGTVNMGNGDNLLSVSGVTDNGVFNVGNGDNTVDLSTISGRGSAIIGNGSNSIYLGYAKGTASLSVGDGNNALRVTQLGASSSVTLGNGSNHVGIQSMKDHSSLRMGDGDNLFSIRSIQGNNSVRTGTGDNLGVIGSLTYNTSLSGSKIYVLPNTSLKQEPILAKYRQAVEERRQQGGLPMVGSEVEGLKERHAPSKLSQSEIIQKRLEMSLTPRKHIDASWKSSEAWDDIMFARPWESTIDRYV